MWLPSVYGGHERVVETNWAAAQFILQPQHTNNPQNTSEGMEVPYCNFEVHLE